MNNLEMFENIVAELTDTYKKKNANYGNSFSNLYSRLGAISGLVPIANKVDRAISLVTNKSENNFESLEDTFKDLANYAIMNLIELRKSYGKK